MNFRTTRHFPANLSTLIAIVASAMSPQLLAADALVIDEIVVTAQKREAGLQDVPVSMTAISGTDLEEIGVGRIEDFIGLVPNVSINFNDSIRATSISIRGIVSDPNNVGIDQAVGVYVDGVYMARPTTINTGVYDTERVEILRGPQGTIFGKNTIAGAISVVTRLPSQSREFEIVGNFGNYGSQRIYAMANAPLKPETLAIRGSIQFEQRDGFLTNLAGPDNNDADNVNGRISLHYTPSNEFDLILRADAAKDRTHLGATEVLVPSPLFAAAPFNTPQDTDPWDRVINDAMSSFQDRDLWGISVEANWDRGDFTITSISAYRTFEWDNFQSADHSPFDILGTGIAEDEEQYSQELRISSNGDNKLDYVAGVYWFKQELDANADAFIGVDAFAPFGAPLGSNPAPGMGTIDIKTANESFAAFGQINYELSERTSLIAGLRYTTEDKDIDHELFGEPTGTFVPSVPFVTFSRTDDEWSPTLGVQHDFSDDAMVYATYSRGFKAGGYNAFSFGLLQADGTPADFEPEIVDSFEIGAKTVFGDGRFRLNAALFYLDYQDLQVNQLIQNAQGIIDFQTSNAASAESRGVELEMAGKISEALEFSLAYGYSDAEYSSFAGATPAGDDFSGNRLAESPENSFSAALQYAAAMESGWNLFGRLEYVSRSSQFSDPDNSPAVKGDSYGLVNGRVGLSSQNERLGVFLWGRNLTDDDYAVVRFFGSGAFAPGAIFQRIGNPRTYGIELSYRWGE